MSPVSRSPAMASAASRRPPGGNSDAPSVGLARAPGLEVLVHDRQQIRLLDEVAAPGAIQVVERVRGNQLLLGESARDRARDARAHLPQHSLVGTNVLAAGDGAVPGDDARVRAAQAVESVIEGDHAVDRAAVLEV